MRRFDFFLSCWLLAAIFIVFLLLATGRAQDRAFVSVCAEIGQRMKPEQGLHQGEPVPQQRLERGIPAGIGEVSAERSLGGVTTALVREARIEDSLVSGPFKPVPIKERISNARVKRKKSSRPRFAARSGTGFLRAVVSLHESLSFLKRRSNLRIGFRGGNQMREDGRQIA